MEKEGFNLTEGKPERQQRGELLWDRSTGNTPHNRQRSLTLPVGK